MMLRIVIALLLLFTSCNKEEVLHRVTFNVLEFSSVTPTCTITYTSDASGGTTVTSTASDSWSSPSLQLKPGSAALLTVYCNEATFDYKLYVYVDGNLLETKTYNGGSSPETISISVP